MLFLETSNTDIWKDSETVTASKIDTIGEPNKLPETEENDNQNEATTEGKTTESTQPVDNNQPDDAKKEDTSNTETTNESSNAEIKQETTTEVNNTNIVSPATEPIRVKGLSAKNKKGKKIFLVWKWQADTEKFQIQYSLNKTFTKKKKTKTVSGYTQSKVISGLKKGKTYYIRVRGCNYSSNGKVYGKWSNIKKVKIKK